MGHYRTIICISLAVASLSSCYGSPVSLLGSPTSFINLDTPSFHNIPPVSITHSRPHLFARSEEFFDLGHPMSTGKSSSSSSSHNSDADLDDAVHAGRFGIELNRLEQVNKQQHDDFIASGYKTDIFGLSQSLPAPLQHLSRRGGSSVGGPIIHELEGIHLDDAVPSLHEFSSFSVDSFPTLFQDPDFDQLQLLSSDRRRRIALPPKNSNRLVVVKTSQPVFQKRHF